MNSVTLKVSNDKGFTNVSLVQQSNTAVQVYTRGASGDHSVTLKNCAATADPASGAISLSGAFSLFLFSTTVKVNLRKDVESGKYTLEIVSTFPSTDDIYEISAADASALKGFAVAAKFFPPF